MLDLVFGILLLVVLLLGFWSISDAVKDVENALLHLDSTLSGEGYENALRRIADSLETIQGGLAPTVEELDTEKEEVGAGLEPRGPVSPLLQIGSIASATHQLAQTANRIEESLAEEAKARGDKPSKEQE